MKAIEDIGGLVNLLNIKPSGVITISAALSIVIGSFISAGIFTPDFARFAKNKKVAVITYVILTKLKKNKDIESVEMAKKIVA